jgi:hypothetical protein
MNDDELMTAVREPLADVHLTTPLDEITRRGKTLRNRRRLRGVTGVTAVAGAIAVAAALLVPGGTSTPPPWTVTKVSDDTIKVTINDLKDPEGLEQELRADGIPARVEFGVTRPPRKLNPHSRAVEIWVGKHPVPLLPSTCHQLPGEVLHNPGSGWPMLYTIRTSDFPKGTGLFIGAAEAIEHGHTGVAAMASRVVATPKCLGS